jgi:hypothetical protein
MTSKKFKGGEKKNKKRKRIRKRKCDQQMHHPT